MDDSKHDAEQSKSCHYHVAFHNTGLAFIAQSFSVLNTVSDIQEEQYVCSTAEALGLPHGPDDAEQILLFQMPSVLPMSRRPGPPPDPGPRGSYPAAASADSSTATPFAELPQGKVTPSLSAETKP